MSTRLHPMFNFMAATTLAVHTIHYPTLPLIFDFINNRILQTIPSLVPTTSVHFPDGKSIYV